MSLKTFAISLFRPPCQDFSAFAFRRGGFNFGFRELLSDTRKLELVAHINRTLWHILSREECKNGNLD